MGLVGDGGVVALEEMMMEVGFDLGNVVVRQWRTF